MGRIVRFYRTENGICPVKKFLDSLQGKMARKVTWVLKLVEELDFIPVQYFKKLSGTEDIWECRTHYGSDTIRISCFFAGNKIVLLTHGVMKKTRKLPKKEIVKAEKHRQNYLSRSLE